MRPLPVIIPARAIASRLVGVFLALVAIAPAANGAPPVHGRLGVAEFSGPNGKVIERIATSVLAERGFRVVALESADADELRLAADQLKLGAVVVGRVTVQRRAYSARIIAREGGGAQTLVQATFSARSARTLAKAVERGLWKRFAPALTPPAPRDAQLSKTLDDLR
jgi:hypothetical protein